MILPNAPANMSAKANFRSMCARFLTESHNQYPNPKMAIILNKVRTSFAFFSVMNGIKSLSLVPIAIPLFSTKRILKTPQSKIAGTP